MKSKLFYLLLVINAICFLCALVLTGFSFYLEMYFVSIFFLSTSVISATSFWLYKEIRRMQDEEYYSKLIT